MAKRAPGKPRQASPRQAGNPPPAPGARGDRARIGISSGQAARYCLVSADTIVNWITAGRLSAQRTAGGQYRIRVSDLRRFMREHEMRTDLLDGETGHEESCWEFWSSASARRGGPDAPPATCVSCPVYLGRAEVCHEVRPHVAGGTLRALSCADCEFLATRSALGSDE